MVRRHAQERESHARSVASPVRPAQPPSLPDEIELACVACTLEWRAGHWQHERSWRR